MSRTLLSLALLAATVVAQTSTTCNPLNATCPPDPALGSTYYAEFNASTTEFDPRFWNTSAGASLISFGDQGAELTISELGQSVTLQTSFYIMWGQVDIVMQPAAGVGIISTMNMLSDDLDEIDWEIMGGNSTTVENNWYGWGNKTDAQYPALSNATGGFHKYSVNYSQQQIQWLIDDAVVRTLPYAAPGLYPQTPMYVKVGIWAGGASTEPIGTRTWAGGETDFSKGPFTMRVQSIKITDGTQNVTSYSFENHSGSYQSITSAAGISQAVQMMNQKTGYQEVKAKWNGLSSGAKIGIACGVLGAFALGLLAFSFYFIKERRRGQVEKVAADKEWESQNAEVLEYRRMMVKGNFAVSSTQV